ncbi:MAG: chloride channel protein [Ruminococcus sp.]
MGAGAELIEKAVADRRDGLHGFLLKMILTALTMRAGFRRGEIVPSFCVGATFGCMAGRIVGLSRLFVQPAEWQAAILRR